MSKSRDKKRLLLDEEELTPRADAWDIFYGKKPTPGVKPPEPPLPAAEPVEAIPTSPSPSATYTVEPASPDLPAPAPSTVVDNPIELPVRPADPPAPVEQDAPPPVKRDRTVAPIAFRARRLTKVDEVPKRVPGKITAENQPAVSSDETTGAGLSFEIWVKRWAPMLKRGASLQVCRVFFDLTHRLGRDDCFTSNTAIMKLSGLSRSQCIRNIHHLQEIGFLDEIGEANNKDAKGTHYRFNLIPHQFS